MKPLKAQSMMQAGVVGLIVTVTMLYLGNIIVKQVETSMESTLGSTTNAIQGNITENSDSAFNLTSLAPLIQGASIVIALILGFAAAVVVGRR